MKDELKLVFPTKEHKEKILEFLQEFLENGENVIHGCGGLDRIKDIDEWFLKIKEDLIRETLTRVKASLFIAIRQSDQRIVGILQIRHRLNKNLLLTGGHIGDSVRPSERRKGYATEMIRLALNECQKLGIGKVLITCDVKNIGSEKSIINNGGILENIILDENGNSFKRYWISLKKKYADKYIEGKVKKAEQKIVSVKEKYFTGDIYYYNFIDVLENIIILNGKSILDNNYKWLEFYDYSSKIRLTAIYNENNDIVEWYFDIANKICKENGIPFEDDLYLDVVVTSSGETILLDEDELKEALDRMEITKLEYEETCKMANELIEKLSSKKEKLQEFTDKYLNLMIGGDVNA